MKTYETKLVNPICARLQKKKLELINFYNITDTQNTIVYHLKGLNIEKIDQKPQNVSDSFFHTTSAITIYQNQTYNSEDLSDKMNKSVTERAKQMESDAIITLDNTLVINEQESLDYYLRNKKSNESLFDFHLELPEINKTKEDSLRVLGEFTIKGFLHKKATVCECRKVKIFFLCYYFINILLFIILDFSR